ncbi:hypothetical protein MMC10_007799 [Thelotrema lepadinum]|nr:hypothetical protein [Thelotrema lepadinum]
MSATTLSLLTPPTDFMLENAPTSTPEIKSGAGNSAVAESLAPKVAPVLAIVPCVIM